MNESMPPPAPFKDRSAGLLVFGILTILLGLLTGLMVPFLIVAGSFNAANGMGEGGLLAMLPAISIYSIVAIANIWLGIGSIMKRRWARALLLISSWAWLIFGSLMTIGMVVLMPAMLKAMPQNSEATLTPGMQTGVWLFTAAFFFVAFVLVPLGWLLFYRSPHVKATCEAAHPLPCWTDACPLPVLALALWMGLGAPCLLLFGLVGISVLPLFGFLLSGWVARGVCILLAILWGWLAWSLYRRTMAAWWMTGMVFLLYMVSTLLTFSRHSLAEFNAAMHISSKEALALQDSSVMQLYTMACPVVLTVLVVGYLLIIRKHFVRRPAA